MWEDSSCQGTTAIIKEVFAEIGWGTSKEIDVRVGTNLTQSNSENSPCIGRSAIEWHQIKKARFGITTIARKHSKKRTLVIYLLGTLQIGDYSLAPVASDGQSLSLKQFSRQINHTLFLFFP